MTTPTIPLSAAETALRKLPSTITREDEAISLQAALDALRGVAVEAWQPIETAQDDTKMVASAAQERRVQSVSGNTRQQEQ